MKSFLEKMKEKMKNKDIKKLIITVFIIVTVAYKIFLSGRIDVFEKRQKIADAPKSEYSQNISEDKKNIEKKVIKKEDKAEKSGKITVYISGAVSNPGVINIDSDKRLDDAIQKVGGLTKDADSERINLAMKLEDSQHYIIPQKGEKPAQAQENNEICQSSSNESKKDSGSENSSGKININSAEQSKLETINGVGPSTAKKIIEYREKEGKFSTIEDIKNISGIGDKKFENMKEYICAE